VANLQKNVINVYICLRCFFELFNEPLWYFETWMILNDDLLRL